MLSIFTQYPEKIKKKICANSEALKSCYDVKEKKKIRWVFIMGDTAQGQETSCWVGKLRSPPLGNKNQL